MLEKLRRTLVESFVGAIALGWMFAQAVFHFAAIFSTPVARWITRRDFRGLNNAVTTGFSLRDGTPELINSLLLFLFGYLLLRWLYFKPTQQPGSLQGKGTD